MELTILGALLGGVLSWLVSHAYYRRAQRDQKEALPDLTSLASEIATLRKSLGTKAASQETISLLHDAERRILATEYRFRSAMQSWIGAFTLLKELVDSRCPSKVREQVNEMDVLMKQMVSIVHKTTEDGPST